MNCTICGFPMTRLNARDQYTCDKCQIEMFPELKFKKKYYHDGDGVIREKEETEKQ